MKKSAHAGHQMFILGVILAVAFTAFSYLGWLHYETVQSIANAMPIKDQGVTGRVLSDPFEPDFQTIDPVVLAPSSAQ